MKQVRFVSFVRHKCLSKNVTASVLVLPSCVLVPCMTARREPEVEEGRCVSDSECLTSDR